MRRHVRRFETLLDPYRISHLVGHYSLRRVTAQRGKTEIIVEGELCPAKFRLQRRKSSYISKQMRASRGQSGVICGVFTLDFSPLTPAGLPLKYVIAVHNLLIGEWICNDGQTASSPSRI